MRSVWKGSLGFGVIPIPVKMYSSVEEKTVHFNQLHRDCNTRIQMPKWCPTCDRKVEAGELVKAYEVSKGQYVPLEEADFETLPIKTLKTMDVVEFIDDSGIDPRHYHKCYFIAPEDQEKNPIGGKAFWLFLKVVEKAGLVAVAKLCYRDREHLATIRPFGGVLLLQTLYYADELRDPSEIEAEAVEISEREMEMAGKLVEALSATEVDLSKYADEYRDALTRLIEAKLAGEVISVAPEAKAPAGDLESSLMASVEAILAEKGVEA